MPRKSKGRIYKRGSIYWLQYYVNGVQIRQSLKTSIERDAKKERDLIVKPLEANEKKEKAKRLESRVRDAEAEVTAVSLSENDIALGDAWEQFEEIPSSRSARTMDALRHPWNAFVEWITANRRYIQTIGTLDRNTTMVYAKHLNKRKISARTFNAHRNALSQVTRALLKVATVDGADPWKHVDTKTEDTLSKRELTQEEVLRLFAKLADPTYGIPSREEWKVIFHLGAFTGLRLADCVLLSWDCVDLSGNTLSLIPIKTKRKAILKRVNVAIHPVLVTNLEAAGEWRRDQFICPNLADRYKYNSSGVQKDAVRVFEDCNFVTQEAVDGRANMTSVVGFHSLRHSFVSFCANAGVPMATVQALVGHGSPAMTRHYTHITRESAEKAILALPIGGEAVGGPGEKLVLSAEDRITKAKAILEAGKRLTKRERAVLAVLGR